MILDEMTWQQVGRNHWIFGRMIRGLVREPVAEAWAGGDYTTGGQWRWRLNIDSGVTNGNAGNLAQAVTNAEAAIERIGE